MPLVTTRSPEFTLSSLATYFMTSSGSPVPPTGLWIRESTSIAPTPLSLSVSSSTCAVSLIGLDHFANRAVRRDHAHVAPDAVALAAVQLDGLAGGVRARRQSPAR